MILEFSYEIFMLGQLDGLNDPDYQGDWLAYVDTSVYVPVATSSCQ